MNFLLIYLFVCLSSSLCTTVALTSASTLFNPFAVTALRIEYFPCTRRNRFVSDIKYFYSSRIFKNLNNYRECIIYIIEPCSNKNLLIIPVYSTMIKKRIVLSENIRNESQVYITMYPRYLTVRNESSTVNNNSIVRRRATITPQNRRLAGKSKAAR